MDQNPMSEGSIVALEAPGLGDTGTISFLLSWGSFSLSRDHRLCVCRVGYAEAL